MALAALAETQPAIITLPQLPSAAQKTIQSQANGRALAKIERVEGDGGFFYDVETIAADGQEWDFTVANDGTLTSLEVPLAETPVAVQTTVKSHVGDGEFDSIEKTLDGKEVVYLAEMTTKAGDDREFTVETDGRLSSMEVALAELPAVAQKTVTAQIGDGRLESIDKAFDGMGVSYEVYVTTKAGEDREFTVETDGGLSSMEVALAELPAAAQKTVAAQAGAARLEGIEKTSGPNATYEVNVTVKDGQKRSFSVEADGTLSSMEVTLADLPVAAQKTVITDLRDGSLDSIGKSFDDEGVSYEVDITTKPGKKWSFTVDASGNFLSSEVTLEQTPAPALKTITDKIGGGRILRINQSYIKRKKVLPFEVDGIKDGQPCDFAVGPGGRFLGWDD